MICPECGHQPKHSVERYQYRESGLDNVFVDGVGIFRCVCGRQYIQLPGAQEVHNQVASGLLKKTSLLTGPEARFLRKWLRLTSDELAKTLGYTRVSVSRMENKGLTVATDRFLRLYVSQVSKISIDVEKLFSSIEDKPDQNFRIVVGETPSVPQYTVETAGTALALASTMEGLEFEPFGNFGKPSAIAQELAGIATGFQYSVKASGTATGVTSGKSFIDMLTNFDQAFGMSSKSAGVTGKKPDTVANQELAQAA